MDNAAVVVGGITTTDTDRGLGGWSGYGTRHRQCSRNFQQHPNTGTVEDCASACANLGPPPHVTCTMFSWGSNGKDGDGRPNPIECRVGLTPEGCAPTPTTSTNNNALEIPANVPTVYERSMGRSSTTTTASVAHGALTSRATSIRVYPAAGGVFAATGGYKERYERPSPESLVLEASNDLLLNVGTTITVSLTTPFLVKKIQARHSPTFPFKASGKNSGCAAKNVKITYPDGTSSLLTFPDNSKVTADMEVMPDTGGPLGGELVSAMIKVKDPQGELVLPVVDSYDLQVMATQGDCPAGGQTTLRSVEMKGDVLMNLALQGTTVFGWWWWWCCG